MNACGFRKRRECAFTVIELLVAMAVTLIMMAALGKMYQIIGRSMQEGRADLRMSAKLRTVAFRLQDELSRCTVKLEAPASGEEPSGYFVYYDGPLSDASTLLITGASNTEDPDINDYRSTSKYGDYDDYLAFTAVAPDDALFTGTVPGALVGQSGPVTITSKYAEIIYWVQPEYLPATPPLVDLNGDDIPDRLRLHRRVLLIRPDLNDSGTGRLPSAVPSIPGSWPDNMRDIIAVYQECDLSVRRPLDSDGLPLSGAVIANSLEDLAKPHNRFGHVRIDDDHYTSMPILDLGGPVDYLVGNTGRPVERDRNGMLRREYSLSGTRVGEDMILSNLVAFDIKVFDPAAPVLLHVGPDGIANGGSLGSDDLVLTPSDPGFSIAIDDTPALAMTGTFVDLNYAYKAGGAIQTRPVGAGPPSGNLNQNILNRCITQFSGLEGTSSPRIIDSLYRSGRYLPNYGDFYQPVFDTWTTFYESDGFDQGPHISGTPDSGTVWWKVVNGTVDGGRDNLDDDDPGVDDASEQEAGPPIRGSVSAIQIELRIEDRKTRQVRKMTVTQNFDN